LFSLICPALPALRGYCIADRIGPIYRYGPGRPLPPPERGRDSRHIAVRGESGRTSGNILTTVFHLGTTTTLSTRMCVIRGHACVSNADHGQLDAVGGRTEQPTNTPARCRRMTYGILLLFHRCMRQIPIAQIRINLRHYSLRATDSWSFPRR